MLILLPPSETKRPGGSGGPLDLGRLSFPELNPVRQSLLTDLMRLSADLPTARAALGIRSPQDGEIFANTAVLESPAMPALDRYTGVLYECLAAQSFTRVQRARADQRLIIASALFGATRATDPIPAYRLSAGSRLPGRPTLAASWKPVLVPALSGTGELVLDLRSGAYAALGPVADAITVSVVTANAGGGRTVVSHFSKATKGQLARALGISRAELNSVSAVVRAARHAGFAVERSGPTALTVVT